MPYKYLLSVSLVCLASTQSFASGKPPKDFDVDKEVQSKNTKKKSDVVQLTRDEILDLTPNNPELLRLAKGGNPDAMSRLGTCFLHGVDCDVNKEQAFYWFKAAAAKDLPSGLYNYAEALFRGDGCQKSDDNTRLAIQCLTKSARLGLDEAKYALARRLLTADGFPNTEANQMQAWNLFRELDALGHARSTLMIAEGFLQKHCSLLEKQEGVKYLERAAKLGSVKALARLGGCYLVGTGCKQDNNKAFDFFRRAYLSGDQSCYQNLLMCLKYGIGTTGNKEFVIQCYKAQALKGDWHSMLNFALSLDQGDGIEKDLKQARYWFEKAAESNESIAIFQLALFYFNNNEYDLALPNFEAIQSEYPVAEYLGYLYFKKRAYEQALECYERASADDYKTSSQSYFNFRMTKVNPRLLAYLRKKVNEEKAVAPHLPKVETTNLAQQSAVEALDQELVSLQNDTVNLRDELVEKLEERKANSDYKEFNPSQELETLNKTYAMALGNLETLDKPTKRTRLTKLAEFLNTIEAKIMAFEYKLESEKRLAVLRSQAMEWNKTRTHEDVESKQDRNVRKEVQAAAAKTLDDEKSQKHKKLNRKHAPLPKGKIINKETEAEEPRLIKFIGPFSSIKKFEKRTKAELTKAMEKKVYEIQDILRDAESMDDAIGLLKKLPFKHDFKEISVGYAGCPDAYIAFEMRIDDQYRVIIAFKKITERAYEENEDGLNNNNNSVVREVYRLYNDRIYVDDPHIKE